MITDVKALELLIKTVRDGTAPILLQDTPEPDHIYWLYNPSNGSLEKHVATPEPRNHLTGTIESFCDLIVERQSTPLVWINETQAVAVLDDEGHRINKCVWRLPYTERWTGFLELLDKSYNQVDFARLLRVTLRGMVPTTIAPVVQSLKLEAGKVLQGEVDRFRDSSSVATRREVSGIDKLPESFTVMVPMLRGDKPMPIECTIEVSLDSGKLSLVAFPDEVSNAVLARIEDLGNEINTRTGVSVFIGTP